MNSSDPPSLRHRYEAARPLELPGRDKAVLRSLMYFAFKSWPQCWPSVATLAEDTGFSERAVKQATRALAAGGQIAKTRRRDASSLYTILVPVGAKCALTEGQNAPLEPRRVNRVVYEGDVWDPEPIEI